jgi:hypothetical protein
MFAIDEQTGRASALTRRLIDESDRRSVASEARRRRWQQLLTAFPDLAQMRVIDLGGVVGEWQRAPVQPASVLVVNLFDQEPVGTIDALTGDACALSAAEVGRFDLAYSNSVLDLVGGHSRRTEFANVVGSLAERHWVQTPNRYFPVDACTLFPFQPLLPLEVRAWLARRWPLGYRRTDDHTGSVLINLSRDPLSAAGLAAYFPDSEIWRERFYGLTKSLIAVRR